MADGLKISEMTEKMSAANDDLLPIVATGDNYKIKVAALRSGLAPDGHSHVPADITGFNAAVTNNAAVIANTAKVSAAGSIDTHSDVDISGVQDGDILVWDTDKFVVGQQTGGGGSTDAIDIDITEIDDLDAENVQHALEELKDLIDNIAPATIGKYVTLLGDGVETEFTVTHGLGNEDLTYSLKEVATKQMADAIIVINDTTAVITFNSPPDEDEFKLTLIG